MRSNKPTHYTLFISTIKLSLREYSNKKELITSNLPDLWIIDTLLSQSYFLASIKYNDQN